jgi:integrase
MPVIKITQGSIESLHCAGATKTDYFDSRTKGLMIQVRSSGRKTYYYRERSADGKTRQTKIGDAETIRLAMVRRLVEKRKKQQLQTQLNRVSQAWGIEAEWPHGDSPGVSTAQGLRAGSPATMATAGSNLAGAGSTGSAGVAAATAAEDDPSPTVSQFLDDAYLPFIRTYKRSYSSDLSLINNHVKPFFGAKTLAKLNKADLLQFIDARRESHMPGTINRVLILMRYVYNLAIKWETPGVAKNPVSDTPLLEENNQRERFLTSEEVDRLVYCVRHSRNEMLQYIVPGLILTGARKQELLRARLQDFCQDTKIWRIPMSKSGKARHVPISDALQQLLDSIPKRCEWVFANPKTLKPFTSFYYSWDTARNQAGLADVRVHDLRHSFASFLVNAGRSLYEVQRILGHTQIKTTQRYAHLDQESLLSAVNTVSAAAPNVLGEGTRPVPIMGDASAEGAAMAGEGGSLASFDLRLRTRRALRKKPSKRREDPV